MTSRIRQLWIQRRAMVVVALLSMASGAVLGAVRYSNRFPAIATFEVKRGEFIDSVQFKVWIEGFDLYAKDAPPGAKGVSITLTGDVTYINVPMSRDLYGVFYVSPAVLARYSSDRGVEDFDRKFNVHLEAYANGALVDMIDKRKEQDPKWFAPFRAVPNLVSRQDQCPFVISDTSRYPMIKPQPSAGSP